MVVLFNEDRHKVTSTSSTSSGSKFTSKGMRKQCRDVVVISPDLVQTSEPIKPNAPKTPEEIVMDALHNKGEWESLKIKREKLSSDSETEL